MTSQPPSRPQPPRNNTLVLVLVGVLLAAIAMLGFLLFAG